MKNSNEGLANNKIKKAFKVTEIAHWFQKRISGEKYFEGHPVKVADLVFKKWQEDENFEKINSEIAKKIEITAYLHDTIEDTVVKLEDIEDVFGKEIEMVIDSLSEDKEKRRDLERSGFSHEEVKVKMLDDSLKKIEALKGLGYADAWEVAATVKVADILQNISTMDNLDKDHRKRNLEKAKTIFEEFNGQIDLAETLGERIEEIGKGEKKMI